ncbi:glycosyltransferase family 2 protein [Marinobacterium sedimentorum]|uniref:glycosyltransferase family 2 protein n=1 Tax=Marinobacterium sedimentorum TaxID=2927804 RepID=UPI0020C66D1F|nr:glycosyltransferase [Marinobacterium sedimentorum]
MIAVYNVENCIRRCLDSVVDQKFDDVEVIVIDGNSRDGTVEIVKEHPVVSKWLSEPDEGIYDAWNKGISLAEGKWVIFLGADDYLGADALKYLAEYCISHDNLDYVSGKVGWVDTSGQLLKTVGSCWEWKKFRKWMNVAHPGSAHNIELYKYVGLYSKSFDIVGDYELLLRKGCKLNAGYVDFIVAYMEVGGVSFMSVKSIYEAYLARKLHCTVSRLKNIYFFCLSYVKLKLKVHLIKLRIILS